jgi:hypothetical protein
VTGIYSAALGLAPMREKNPPMPPTPRAELREDIPWGEFTSFLHDVETFLHYHTMRITRGGPKA